MVEKDAEMMEEDKRGGREGTASAGARSTQTDAVERRWLEKKEQGQHVCVCVHVCSGRERRG